MARASPMVLDYGSLNKKWTGDTTVSHGTSSFLACSVGTVLMGVVCCLVDRQEHYRDLSPDSCGQCIYLLYSLRTCKRQSHIEIMLCILHSESNSSLRTRRPRLLTCVQAPRRFSVLFDMPVSCATILVRLICRIARFDDVGSNQEHENS